MTFEQAVDFIVEGLKVPASDRRASRDKVRKRVRYGLGDGTLPRLDLLTTDVDLNELVLWSRQKWPGKFTDTKVQVFEKLSDGVGLGAGAQVFDFPANLQACHTVIRDLLADRRLLQMMVTRQAAVIAELRPLAEQYERNRAKNRASAGKPRPG